MKPTATADELYDNIVAVERMIKRQMHCLTFTEQLEHYNHGGRIKLETVTVGGPVRIINGAAQ